MSDQAIGFLLEFRNEASEDLQQAVNDFDQATEALERAVDAAQAAFTFLEEGTGALAGKISASVDSVAKKTGELQSSMESLGSVEVEAPDIDPIQQAMSSLGEGIQEPLDSGVEEVSDSLDDLNEKNIQGPSIQEWIAYQTMVEDSNEAVEEVAQSTSDVQTKASEFVATLHDMSDAALTSRSEMRQGFDALDAVLVQVGNRIFKETSPKLEEFGEKGQEAAAAIASDAVAAYERLQDSAERFFVENAEAFTEANNVAEVWQGFLATEEGDLRKVQDLLRVADKATLEPMIEGLVEQLGDAALAEEFWKPIASNENVDKEFFRELRDRFKSEDKTYETWWDRLNETGQNLFWPVFVRQGERASETIGKKLGGVLKSIFSSPIAQFTAAIQISNLITKIFAPAIEVFTEIVSRALLPLMRVFIELMYNLEPAIRELTRAFVPLAEGLGLVAAELIQAILPLFIVLVDLFIMFSPVIVKAAEIVGGIFAFAFEYAGKLLAFVAEKIEWLTDGTGYLMGGLKDLLGPVIDFAYWLDELLYLSDILGYVLGVFVLGVLGSLAAHLWTVTIPSMIKFIASTDIGAASMLFSFVPAIWTAVTATWAFTAALLANPLTWIVLAIAAGVAVLVGIIWLLWEPITKLFNFMLDLLEPIFNWVSDIVEKFDDWGLTIFAIVFGPLGWLVLLLRKIVDLTEGGWGEAFWSVLDKVKEWALWLGERGLLGSMGLVVAWSWKLFNLLKDNIGPIIDWIGEKFSGFVDILMGVVKAIASVTLPSWLSAIIDILSFGSVGSSEEVADNSKKPVEFKPAGNASPAPPVVVQNTVDDVSDVIEGGVQPGGAPNDLIAAIREQTRTLESVISNSGVSELELNIPELDAAADFA